jgi:hypothetical protein
MVLLLPAFNMGKLQVPVCTACLHASCILCLLQA